MSNFLAIATVTATLRQMLEATIGIDVPGATVTTQRPDAIGGAPGLRVNLYLYQVAHNAAWRNADLPTRRTKGELVQRPQVALNLHYLLTFYGDEGNLEPQRLLGSAVRTLHARPVLTRKMIRDAIASPNFNLANSNLAEQIELVRLTPIPLSTEEFSKLWSVFFQTPYNLSIAYQGTVVLIESEETPQSALPVRERNLYVVPFRQPVIEQVMSQAGINLPITAGSTLVIRGKQLRGDVTRVRIGKIYTIPGDVTEMEISLQLPPEYLFSWDDIPGNDNGTLIEFLKKRFGISWVETAKIEKIDGGKAIRLSFKDNFLSLNLNDDKTKVRLKIDDVRTDEFIARTENRKLNIYPPSLQAGVQGVQVVHQMLMGTPPVPHLGVESNVAAFVLHPSIMKDANGNYEISISNIQTDVGNTKKAKITVKLNPKVGKQQRVVILLNDLQPTAVPVKAYSFNAEPRTSDTDITEFQVKMVVPDEYLVRVQVDGAESLLDVDADTKQYISPKVKIDEQN